MVEPPNASRTLFKISWQWISGTPLPNLTEIDALADSEKAWDRFRMERLLDLLVRLARSPRTIITLLFDRFLVPAWMRLNRIQIGRGCRFAGQPVVSIARGAWVRLGDDG